MTGKVSTSDQDNKYPPLWRFRHPRPVSLAGPVPSPCGDSVVTGGCFGMRGRFKVGCRFIFGSRPRICPVSGTRRANADRSQKRKAYVRLSSSQNSAIFAFTWCSSWCDSRIDDLFCCSSPDHDYVYAGQFHGELLFGLSRQLCSTEARPAAADRSISLVGGSNRTNSSSVMQAWILRFQAVDSAQCLPLSALRNNLASFSSENRV